MFKISHRTFIVFIVAIVTLVSSVVWYLADQRASLQRLDGYRDIQRRITMVNSAEEKEAHMGKQFCWTPQTIISLIGLVFTATIIIWSAASYFGGEKKAAEQVANEQDRVVNAYIALTSRVDNLEKGQVRVETKLDLIEKKIDKLDR